MPPGLLDFLRGTIALFKYSRVYGYHLYINKDAHPLFKYFEDCEYYIHDGNTNIHKTYELLSQASASFVDHILEKLFQHGSDFYVITNCFIQNKNNTITNDIDNQTREFIKKILTPNQVLRNKLNEVYRYLSIYQNEIYYCIHIRFGDAFLHTNNTDLSIVYAINSTIQSIIEQHKNTKIILVTDSSNMTKEIMKINPTLLYWDNKKIHLGSLINYNEEAIVDTLTDIFILSGSKKIHTININNSFVTTFSPLISNIYGIENTVYQLVN
jgi:hypothetical protein